MKTQKGKQMDLVRTIKNSDGTYTTIDMQGNKRSLKVKDIKSLMLNEQLNVIDLQIDKTGRLVNKKVEFRDICRQINIYNREHKALSVEEQELILFYGLARINQLSIKTKEKLFEKIEAIHTMDEEDLKSLFTDNENWNFHRYRYLDTACRDKVIELIYYLAGTSKNDRYSFYMD